MDPMAKNLQAVERRLFESLGSSGGIIPQTVEQVELAERCGDLSEMDLPERLRDPRAVFARIVEASEGAAKEAVSPVFGQFVSMMRRKHGYSVEALAAKAKVEAREICQIEVDAAYEAKPRTVSQLAAAFGLAPKTFARLANLRSKGDSRISEGAVRFAACSKGMDTLTEEQRRALKDFVKLLNSLD